jgi:orotate phosphoribosyltransferase
MINVKQIYKESNALLEGHFLLSSGNHSKYYLQSAKVLENPQNATLLAEELAKQIQSSDIEVDTICSPALGGILAGFTLATAMKKRFIFTERVNKNMTLRRGFDVKKGEKYIICEDIITTGGSALEAANEIQRLGGEVVAYAALANRGFCSIINSGKESLDNCKLPTNKPLFALENFEFDIYTQDNCPLCKEGLSSAYKPGSRGN